jgi:hypothetical protein
MVHWLLVFAVSSAAVSAPNPSSEGGRPIILDGTKQLFLDNHIIDTMDNVTRRLHPAEKRTDNPILAPTEPWENHAIFAGSVIRDGSKFKMWYQGGGVAYAESDDGLHWTKPKFDLVEIDGRKTNVLVKMRLNAAMDEKANAEYEAGVANAIPYLRAPMTVFRDPFETDPARAYKMVYLMSDYTVTPKRRGMGLAVSPDGIHWKVLGDWITESANDASRLMVDHAERKYVLYGRTDYHSSEVRDAWGTDPYFRKANKGRAVTRLESSDLLAWDYTEWRQSPITLCVDTRDPIGTEIYTMVVFPYEGIYIGLPQIFHNRQSGTLLDMQLAVSRDSRRFLRVGERKPFLPCGDVSEWDRFNNSIAGPPIDMGDELWFYYSGRVYRHSPYRGSDNGPPSSRGLPRSHIGLAIVKKDRFVSLGASFDKGHITTKPVRLAGNTLHLNAKSDHGEIQVELLDAAGDVIATSKPVRGDGLDMPVEWDAGDATGVEGPVSLRITLSNALLFAIWCV